ncbi:MAG TPA: ATP-grasp domain-containing protein [Acidobacteriaceae bacterium]|jgi:hypothetical protein|nr:ATP-grasp domain-containing protein [Acidobacteriaceae bacterium]
MVAKKVDVLLAIESDILAQSMETINPPETASATGEVILCISSYEKGQPFLRECARQGCNVVLLTLDKLRDADWPRECLQELVTMPQGMTPEQITNTVTYLARSRKFARIVALDEFDMETAASLREHMRIPGMGLTTTRYFRDKLAMRTKAAHLGIRVPEFTAILNYDDLRAYMSSVPAPWLLKPRAEASAIGIKKIHHPEELWRTLDELGDRQSCFLMERFVPGDIFHVDAITSESKVVFSAAHSYGTPPMQVMHEGGVFTTRAVVRASEEDVALKKLNAAVMQEFGMVRGVTHTEFIRAHDDGAYYFLETAARVGGAFIADVIEHTYGINPWVEWARVEIVAMRGQAYTLPPLNNLYAGSVLCLARMPDPDTSHYDAPEVVYRLKKHHHAGLIVQSTDPQRIASLLEEYSVRFCNEFCAVQPVPDRPPS